MKRYLVTLKGTSPIIMHRDNLNYSESIKEWQIDPANKQESIAGDDRSPAWTWIGYLYHDNHHIGIPSDNIMTMLREGGAKLRVGKGNETYKKQTQAGLLVDAVQWDLLDKDSKPFDVGPINQLIGEKNFQTHIDVAKNMGFELLVKRAKVGQSKHIRVRPLFRNWSASGTITVLDEDVSGLKKNIFKQILNLSGALCGLCDWRPSSPKSQGPFGKFEIDLKAIS